MVEASKKLASEEYTLDLRDKNRGKMKNFLKRLIFSYYVGKSYFDDDRSESYLMFQPVFKYFEIFSGTIDKIFGWKSKSEESIKTPTMSENSFPPKSFIIPYRSKT